VGSQGHGTFNQIGGTITSSFQIYVGSSSNSASVYNLSGGSITTPFETIGQQGHGTFNQSGGRQTISGGGLGLSVGENAFGAYTLSGNATLNVDWDELIGGFNGSGIFTQTGGTNSMGLDRDGLIIGRGQGATGAYTLTGGTVTAPAVSLGSISEDNNTGT